MIDKLKEANTETRKWETVDGDYKTLSWLKMQQKLDLTHPRLYLKNEESKMREAQKIAICHPLGSIEDGFT